MSRDLFLDLGWLLPPPADFTARCREAGKAADADTADLRALAQFALNDNQLLALAGALARRRAAVPGLKGLVPFKLAIVSNSTTNFIAAAVAATGLRHGLDIECVTGAYDQGLQESLDPQSTLHRAQPNAVLVAFDWRGLPVRSRRTGTAAQDSVDSTLQLYRTIRQGWKAHGEATCIVQNLAPPPEVLYGSLDRHRPDSLRHAVGSVNAGLAADLADSSDVLLDVDALAATVGLSHWHAPGEWNSAKQPFAMRCLALYADHVCRTVAALRGKSRRCLVLDLDNTLWGGVIGDDGVAGIQVAQGDAAGEAFLDFQRYALELRERGIVLAVSSKNTDEVARLPFRNHPEMLIREQHIAVFQANWNDKATNIAAIAKELSLGLESLVFVDDNPMERNLVRTMLPQVAVPEMPADPALYARTLSAAGYFELARFSAEDRERARYYEGNARRTALQQQVGDLDQYLASLDMEIVFQPFDAIGTARISQLIMKSNQYNLTTRRYSEAEVQRLAAEAGCHTLQVRLTDTFGDNGMISVVVSRARDDGTLDIDTWLMSCRVLGRKVEHMVLRELLALAQRCGLQRLHGTYIPTERNQLVEDHYPKLGFRQVARRDDGTTEWELDVAGAEVPAAPMRVRRVGFEA